MKDYEKLYLLYVLIREGALKKAINISTRTLGKKLSVSPQSVSRKLIELENEGLIERRVTNRGQVIALTHKGIELVYSFYSELKKLIEPITGALIILKGRVFRGLGEGAFYVSIPEYRRQFVEKLGFDPYPGTLNIRLDPSSLPQRRLLDIVKCIEIKPFSNRLRSYGGAKVFHAIINDKVRGAIVIPERTHYGPDVIEIIAPVELRKILNLREGSWVVIKVYC
ncbi:MAG: riboflavin kinase [Thermoprotei archaeon]|nr:MAG: riboflavin kinase [Thermoprotei archaeon]RLF01198.1 MAG: riboflavin kinase [Thermoprotei archaeon]